MVVVALLIAPVFGNEQRGGQATCLHDTNTGVLQFVTACTEAAPLIGAAHVLWDLIAPWGGGEASPHNRNTQVFNSCIEAQIQNGIGGAEKKTGTGHL